MCIFIIYRRRLRRANAAPLLYLGLRRAFEACVRRLMGSVPLLGVLCAWGGTLQYFLESFFLVFSSAPGFPRWSFYAARGEHLWSFLGNVIPQLLQRNLKQRLFFDHKIEDFGVFWGYGPRWGPGLESSWQKEPFPRQKSNHFGGHFGIFSAF